MRNTDFPQVDRTTPADDADELTWLLFRQHGVISRRQALRFMTPKRVRTKLDSDRWRSVHRGVYVTHTGPVTAEQRDWIAVLAAGAGRPTYLAGLSALRVLGFRWRNHGGIHVLLPAKRRDQNAPDGVVVHRTRSLPAQDRNRVTAPPTTTASRSIVDAAQWASSDDEARTIVASGFQQRLVGGDDIDQVLSRMPVAHRRALITRTAKDARDGSESTSELDFIALCRRGGLPEPSRQVVRTDASGRRRYLDAYFEEWGLHVEIDGGHHLRVDQWWADMKRQNELWIAGDRVLRFPAWLVRERPDEVIAQLYRALTALGWVPRRS